jgi:hypothetical protein
VYVKAASATKTLTAILGVLVGLAGLEHGLFETLQGNTRPAAFLAPAIGPEQEFWEGAEHALMIVPNYLISGILTMVVATALMVCATFFTHKRWSAVVLAVLALALWLVGGGFGPVFLSIFLVIAATRIGRPLTLWSRLPARARALLSALWPWPAVVFAVLFLFDMAMGVFGWPLRSFLEVEATGRVLMSVGYVVLVFVVLSLAAALSRDVGTPRHEGASEKAGWDRRSEPTLPGSG